jgi:cytochrome b subunit of formate dehydrogenase
VCSAQRRSAIAAPFFVPALLSGFAIYTPWLFRWLTPLFGGGAMTRELHPWFSLGLVVFFALQVLNWRQPMSWTPDDNRWMRRLGDYVANTDAREPEYVDFFDAGQKVYFKRSSSAAARSRQASLAAAGLCSPDRRVDRSRLAAAHTVNAHVTPMM